MGNWAARMPLVTPVADIGCAVKPGAAFFHEILAVLVTGGAGSTFDITENNLPADIFLLAMKTVDAKVFGIQKESPARIEVR